MPGLDLLRRSTKRICCLRPLFLPSSLGSSSLVPCWRCRLAQSRGEASVGRAEDGEEDTVPTSDRIRIERATTKDIEGIAQTYVDSARHHRNLDPELYQVPTIEDVVRDLARDWDGPDQATLVALVEGTVVGSVDVRLARPRTEAGMVKPRIVANAGIAILGPYRRQGIGRRLMEAAEQWARSRGAETMTLDCHSANRAAISFYQSLGYHTTGLLMRKRLEAYHARDERGFGHPGATPVGQSSTGNDFYCQQVLTGRLPVDKVYETERVLAFHHTRPAYPMHLVVIPKTHVPSLVDLDTEGDDLLLQLLSAVRRIAAEVVSEHGACRVVTNLGEYQDSKHLHWHVVFGERPT